MPAARSLAVNANASPSLAAFSATTATSEAADTMNTSAAHAVRDLLLDRLTQGVYPLGSKLPTAQALASELGLHRNTVAKSYQNKRPLTTVSLTAAGRKAFTDYVDLLEKIVQQTRKLK